jgi:hypothetical protein
MRIAIYIICIMLCMAALAYVAAVYTPLGIVLRQNPGGFDRARLEAVVEMVRTLDLKPGEVRALRLDDPADPSSLRTSPPGEQFARGRGAGNVWAEKTAAGGLKVVVETRDLGHAGEYGFAYTDAPLALTPLAEGWSTVDVPGHMNIVRPSMQIDEHWWEVVYNLD